VDRCLGPLRCTDNAAGTAFTNTKTWGLNFHALLTEGGTESLELASV
jgi:hypothetical protein